MTIKDARILAVGLLKQHDLWSKGWRFRYDRSLRRFGRCQYTTKLVTMSKHLTELNDEHHVRDTLLHEIAHALVGPKAGHGPEWRMKCREIGARPERCYSGISIKQPDRPWIGTCPRCQKETKRYRRHKLSCRRCVDKFTAAGVGMKSALEMCEFKWSRA